MIAAARCHVCLLALLAGTATSLLPMRASRAADVELPDTSLTLDEYERKGVPAPSEAWGPQEYEAAADVLRSVAREDPLRLPRRGSARSGPLFERLADRENLTPMTDPNTPVQKRVRMLRAYDGAVAIASTYAEASEGAPGAYDDELVDLYALVLRLHLNFAQSAEEFIATIAKDDPTRAARVQAMQGTRKAAARWVREMMPVFAEAAPFGTAAESRLAAYLAEDLPPLFKYFAAGDREQVLELLDVAADEVQDAAVRKAVQVVAKSCREVPPPVTE